MPHELNASIQVTLPDDPKGMAASIATITEAWSLMLTNLDTEGLQSSLTINETRAKPAAKANGERQPRTRRTTAQIAEDKATNATPTATDRLTLE